MDDCAAQIAHHSRRPKRPVRFLITAADCQRGWSVWNLAQTIAPQAPQYNSAFALSFCMLHWPHAGHGGRPFSLAFTRGPVRGFFLLGLNQPFFGRFTLGTAPPCRPEQPPLKKLPDNANMSADGIIRGMAIAGHAMYCRGSWGVWTFMRSQTPRSGARG